MQLANQLTWAFSLLVSRVSHSEMATDNLATNSYSLDAVCLFQVLLKLDGKWFYQRRAPLWPETRLSSVWGRHPLRVFLWCWIHTLGRVVTTNYSHQQLISESNWYCECFQDWPRWSRSANQDWAEAVCYENQVESNTLREAWGRERACVRRRRVVRAQKVRRGWGMTGSWEKGVSFSKVKTQRSGSEDQPRRHYFFTLKGWEGGPSMSGQLRRACRSHSVSRFLS